MTIGVDLIKIEGVNINTELTIMAELGLDIKSKFMTHTSILLHGLVWLLTEKYLSYTLNVRGIFQMAKNTG